MASKEMMDYYNRTKLQPDMFSAYLSEKKKLQNVCNEKFQGSKLVLFGSALSGFGASNCDADMCLWFPPQCALAGNPKDTIRSRRILVKLNEHLRGQGESCAVVERNLSDPDTRVPILECKHKRHGTNIDVNVDFTDGVVATYLQKLYSNRNEHLAPLVLIVKQWAKKKGIADASMGTLKSYAWVLMVINYLQVKQILPTYKPRQGWGRFRLADANIAKLEQEIINGSFSSDLFEASSVYSYYKGHWTLEDLLKGFFEYYANFDFQRSKITVREGSVMARAYSNDEPISIEDPILGLNVAAKVRNIATSFLCIQAEFRRACEVMRNPTKSWKSLV